MLMILILILILTARDDQDRLPGTVVVVDFVGGDADDSYLQQFNSFAPISDQEVADHFNGKTNTITAFRIFNCLRNLNDQSLNVENCLTYVNQEPEGLDFRQK